MNKEDYLRLIIDFFLFSLGYANQRLSSLNLSTLLYQYPLRLFLPPLCSTWHLVYIPLFSFLYVTS